MPEIQTSILNGLFLADSEQCETGCQRKTNVNINRYNWDKICCMAEEVSHRGHTDKVRNQCFSFKEFSYFLEGERPLLLMASEFRRNSLGGGGGL